MVYILYVHSTAVAEGFWLCELILQSLESRNNNLWCVHTNETFYTERATLISDSMDGLAEGYNTLINTNHSVIEDSLLSDIVSFC